MSRYEELEYARAYILPQEYENLYCMDEALSRGTIFRDLYRPYKSNCDMNDYDRD